MILNIISSLGLSWTAGMKSQLPPWHFSHLKSNRMLKTHLKIYISSKTKLLIWPPNLFLHSLPHLRKWQLYLSFQLPWAKKTLGVSMTSLSLRPRVWVTSTSSQLIFKIDPDSTPVVTTLGQATALEYTPFFTLWFQPTGGFLSRSN